MNRVNHAEVRLPCFRVASGEELLPVSHLLAGQTMEVPSHVKKGLQDALQAVPVSDYSPLDHHSGACQKLAVSLFFEQNRYLRLRLTCLYCCCNHPAFLQLMLYMQAK